jgi:endonuclease G, mitochondrial
MMYRLLIWILLAIPLQASAGNAPQGCEDHFLGGIMPDVSQNRAQKARQLCYSQFALLHSGVTKTPVWSAEHLTTERLDAASGLPRKNPFHVEARLPEDERASLLDYKSASREFDRGHMSPNGDMPNVTSQRQSFTLANMIPQHACNNEVIWAGIEDSVRKLTKDEDEVYVVTGPIYVLSQQQGEVEAPRQIGEGGVMVPFKIFKAIYVPTRDEAGVYVTENKDTDEWKKLSVQELAALIDVDVFPAVSQKVKAQAMELPPPGPARFGCRLKRQQ